MIPLRPHNIAYATKGIMIVQIKINAINNKPPQETAVNTRAYVALVKRPTRRLPSGMDRMPPLKIGS